MSLSDVLRRAAAEILAEDHPEQSDDPVSSAPAPAEPADASPEHGLPTPGEEGEPPPPCGPHA